MNSYLQGFGIGLAGGLFGFAHCLGMCGAFVLLLAQEKGGRVLAGEVQWLFGKLFGYLFLGAVAGFAGGWLEGVLGGWVLFQTVLSLLVGGLLVLAALSLLGLLPVRVPSDAEGGIVTLCYQKAFAGVGPGAPFLFGIGTAFLPCPIVLAVVAYAVQQGSVPGGMASMGGLALGSSVPLLILGTAGRKMAPVVRPWMPRLVGVLLLIAGVGTVVRSSPLFHHLVGCPMQGAVHGNHQGGERFPAERHHEGVEGHH